jgi:predicted acetyltransferase
MTPSTAARDLIRVVHDAWRLRQAGEIWRRDISWDLGLGLADEAWGERWKGWLILHRDASGTVDGYARYKADPKWESHLPQGTLQVNELCALTDGAYADLVRYLLAVDLVGIVKLEGRREGEPLPWLLTNIRAANLVDAGDALWVRLFDVPRAMEARTYEREGSLVLEVLDDAAPGRASRLLLDAGPAGSTCRSTDRPPDLSLPIAALSGAYLGGTRLRNLVLGTGVDEHRPGALAEADALLRTTDQPWCSTFF